MSRSYKKHVIIKDYSKYTRYFKRLASKKVRRFKDRIRNGSYYRKIYNSYNIFDVEIWLDKDD